MSKDTKKITVTFTCNVNHDATDDEIQSWLEFNLNANGRLDNSVISNDSLDANPFSVNFDCD